MEPQEILDSKEFIPLHWSIVPKRLYRGQFVADWARIRRAVDESDGWVLVATNTRLGSLNTAYTFEGYSAYIAAYEGTNCLFMKKEV